MILDPRLAYRIVRRKQITVMTLTVCWVLGMALFFLSSWTDRSRVTVLHHDGIFSLNRGSGPEFTPDEFYSHMKGYDTFGCVVLVGNPSTRLTDWTPFLVKGGEAGTSFYRIKSGDRSFAFALPSSNGYAEDEVSVVTEIIDLRNHVSSPQENIPPSDVVVLVEPETTCDQLLDALGKFSAAKSVTVMGEDGDWDYDAGMMTWLHRPRNHSSPSENEFVLRPSKFYSKYVQPLQDYLKKF